MPRLDLYVEYKLYVSVRLRSDNVMIGRDAKCDLILNNSRVSRQHAVIRTTEPGHKIGDLSTNGMRVNESMLGPDDLNLAAGDRIYIENYILIYQPDSAPPENLSIENDTLDETHT